MLIGYTGNATRFPTAGRFAAYNGTAPIDFSSSGRAVHRLSRRGNRTLNHAVHMIAVTGPEEPRLRTPHEPDSGALSDARYRHSSPSRLAW